MILSLHGLLRWPLTKLQSFKRKIGLDLKQVVTGMQIKKIHPDTSAAESTLQVDDVINILSEGDEDEFLAGIKVSFKF